MPYGNTRLPYIRRYLAEVFGFVVDNGKVIRGCPEGGARDSGTLLYGSITFVFWVCDDQGILLGTGARAWGSRFASRKPDVQR